MRDIQQVPDHTAGRALGACSWSAQGEGNIRVAARAEVEDVLGTAYGSERTLHRGIAQPDRDGSLPRNADQVAEHVVFFDREEARGESLVVFGKTPHEFL